MSIVSTSSRTTPVTHRHPAYYTPKAFREHGGCSRAQLYRLEAAGKLALTRTIDGRVLISAAEAQRYFGEVAA